MSLSLVIVSLLGLNAALLWVCRRTILSQVSLSGELLPFLVKFLAVFLPSSAADWFQGGYLYTLYQSYGFDASDIAMFFSTGYLTSCLLGGVAGNLADRKGRKKGVLFYCLITSIGCYLKSFPDKLLIIVSHICTGIGVSLLYSVFESWSVHELSHGTVGSGDDKLPTFFFIMNMCNSFIAIVAGVVANELADAFSPYAPFTASTILCVISAAFCASLWNENKAGSMKVNLSSDLKDDVFEEDAGDDNARKGSSSLSSIFGTIVSSLTQNVIVVGLMQTAFETSLFTFIFFWNPILQEVSDDIPYGLTYAAFMVAMMSGNSLFSATSHFIGTSEFLSLLRVAFIIGFLGCTIAMKFSSFSARIFGFLLFEVGVGCFWPCIGFLRGRHFPEDNRTTFINLFRIPTNFIVVVILNIPSISAYHGLVFVNIFLALGLGASFCVAPHSQSPPQ